MRTIKRISNEVNTTTTTTTAVNNIEKKRKLQHRATTMVATMPLTLSSTAKRSSSKFNFMANLSSFKDDDNNNNNTIQTSSIPPTKVKSTTTTPSRRTIGTTTTTIITSTPFLLKNTNKTMMIFLFTLLLLWCDMLQCTNAERDFNFNETQVPVLEAKDAPQKYLRQHQLEDPYLVELSRCYYADPEIVLSLVLKDRDWSEISDNQKTKLLEKLSKFFAIPKEFIQMDSITKHDGLRMLKSALQKGLNKSIVKKHLGRVSFVIGCGPNYFTMGTPIANQIGHQVKDGSLDNITSEKFGWWIIWHRDVKARSKRTRRQATEGSGSEEVEDDYDYGDDTEEDINDNLTETPAVATSNQQSQDPQQQQEQHAHRHHHGDVNESELSDNQLKNSEGGDRSNSPLGSGYDDASLLGSLDLGSAAVAVPISTSTPSISVMNSNVHENPNGNIDEDIVEGVSQLESVISKTIENTKHIKDIVPIESGEKSAIPIADIEKDLTATNIFEELQHELDAVNGVEKAMETKTTVRTSLLSDNDGVVTTTKSAIINIAKNYDENGIVGNSDDETDGDDDDDLTDDIIDEMFDNGNANAKLPTALDKNSNAPVIDVVAEVIEASTPPAMLTAATSATFVKSELETVFETDAGGAEFSAPVTKKYPIKLDNIDEVDLHSSIDNTPNANLNGHHRFHHHTQEHINNADANADVGSESELLNSAFNPPAATTVLQSSSALDKLPLTTQISSVLVDSSPDPLSSSSSTPFPHIPLISSVSALTTTPSSLQTSSSSAEMANSNASVVTSLTSSDSSSSSSSSSSPSSLSPSTTSRTSTTATILLTTTTTTTSLSTNKHDQEQQELNIFNNEDEFEKNSELPFEYDDDESESSEREFVPINVPSQQTTTTTNTSRYITTIMPSIDDYTNVTRITTTTATTTNSQNSLSTLIDDTTMDNERINKINRNYDSNNNYNNNNNNEIFNTRTKDIDQEVSLEPGIAATTNTITTTTTTRATPTATAINIFTTTITITPMSAILSTSDKTTESDGKITSEENFDAVGEQQQKSNSVAPSESNLTPQAANNTIDLLSTPTTPNTSLDTDDEESHIYNTPPIIKTRLPKINVISGKYFVANVPNDIFYDNEDLTNLRVEMNDQEGRELSQNSWLQFNSETREIYGVPVFETAAKYFFQLKATDSGNESISETVDIKVNQHRYLRSFNHEINITVKINEISMPSVDWQIKLIKGIAETLGDQNPDAIVVRQIPYTLMDPSTAVLVYFNETLSTSSCPEAELSDIVKRLDANRLTDLVQPVLSIKSITGQMVGACQKQDPTPTKPPFYTAKNQPPEQRNQVDRVNATIGHLLVYKVPVDTFYDPDDNKLTLSLRTKDNKELSPRHWLQFDSKNNEFYGIPKSADMGTEEYLLVAEDSGGLKATDALVVIVSHAPKKEFAINFKAYLGIRHEQFNADLQRKFVERISQLFGDTENNYIQIRSITTNHDSDSTIVNFYNTSLYKSHNRCPEAEIEATRSVYLMQDTSVRDRVKKILGPELNLTNFQVLPMASCHSQTDGGHRDFIPPKADEPTLKSAFSEDYMIIYILPTVIIVSMIIIACIIACCLHRRKRKSGKMELGDEEERKSFRAKGIPVIFQDELDEKPEIGNKSPIILKDERPPLLPPSYNTSNINGDNDVDEYVPPPAVVVGGREARGKSPATPSYRKPPPYVSP